MSYIITGDKVHILCEDAKDLEEQLEMLLEDGYRLSRLTIEEG